MIIEIKVVPLSGKQEFVLDKTGILKCYLKSVPERNAANKELVKLLAQELKITQTEVQVVGGLISRKKKIKIENLTEEQFWQRLGFADAKEQKKLF